jgi:F0F1-type ATP synthase membrane subunit c/vacuolar-type H+-ATPase subunit K
MKLFERMKSREDNLLAAGIAWTIGIFWSVTFGFYMGCIAGSPHEIDIQKPLMAGSGLTGAGIGLIFGVSLALFFTVVYPRWTAEDAREEAEADAHH